MTKYKVKEYCLCTKILHVGVHGQALTTGQLKKGDIVYSLFRSKEFPKTINVEKEEFGDSEVTYQVMFDMLEEIP